MLGRKGCVSLALALAATTVWGGEIYEVDPVHSNVEFKIRHLVGYVTGHFRVYSGTVDFDPQDLTRSSVRFSIRAASIDTANGKRDDDLRSPNFFDVQKFPEITFKSKSISKGSGNTYKVTGDFTLHGVTKEITLPVEFLGTVKDPWGNERAGFSTSLTLNRKDYGIVWNQTLDAGGLMLGDDVQITVALETVKKKAEPAPATKGSGGR